MLQDGAEVLQIDVEITDGEVLLRVRGEVDPSTTGQLEREIDASVRDDHDLVIDLSAVPFMDSSGLSVLISAHRRMRDRNRRLVLRNPSHIVSRLLEISQLTGELIID